LALEEARHVELRRALRAYDRLFSANLLEAEVRSALAREGVSDEPLSQLGRLEWVWPKRALTQELVRALSAGFLRGADLWHLASALYLRGSIDEPLDFLTLDVRQGQVASALGFAVP
jgi:hypothetical protein